jgi:predicted solute-binding protein
MANLIIDIIKKGNFISREIKMEDYFESLRYKYSKEEHSPFIYD